MQQPEETFLEHLRTIERIAAFVCRRNHLSPDETADFCQEVKVRLLDDDYAVIRKFEGRSSFSTYLTTVIQRLFHQWRVEQWGKWRPSAEAKRLGDKAVTLERLLTRDGYSFAEAVQVLTTPAGAVYTVAELEAIHARLPLRNPRPVLISDEVSAEAVASDGDADERIEAGDRERTARSAASTIDKVLGGMEAEDRLILQMRFWEQRKVPDIARRLQLEQKKVYKRLDKLFASMRRALEEAGVRRRDVDRLLSSGDQDLRFASTQSGPGNPHNGPSQKRSGEVVGGGEGRLR